MDFRLLGPLEVRCGDTTLDVRRPKERALLAFMLLRPNEAVHADDLVEALWPQAEPAAAKRSLEVHVSRLRVLLGAAGDSEPRVFRSAGGYGVRVGPDERDIDRFEHLLAVGTRALENGDPVEAALVLRDALTLWRGRSLVDVAFETFAQPEISRLEELHAAAIEARVDADLQLGRHDQLVGELRGVVTKEPRRESTWRQLMLALYRSGRQEEALAAYGQMRARLLDELGLLPSEELRGLERAILAHEPALRTSYGDPVKGSIHASTTSLVGRERDLERASRLLREQGVRLLTLAGPAGVGKTRLALAIGSALRSRFADGSFFVDLAPVSDLTLVPRTVAEAVRIAIHGEDSARMLRAGLRGRALLLVLDNFEHLLPAAPFVAELLAAAPRLAIVVGSREPLQIYGEYVHRVAPLELPSKGTTDPAELANVESVALFVERARAADTNFALSHDNAPTIAAICDRLDGLPLALELAAAYAATLPPKTILRRLDERLEFLQHGPRDLPVRQRSLRAAIDWSHELLDEEEQRAFRRLAVFVDGCTAESVRDVCQAEEAVVESLVRKSLLRRLDGTSARVGMLETIREYAADRLRLSGELEQVRLRHADFFVDLAEEAAPHLRGREQLRWLLRLDDDQGNLRAALEWGLQSGNVHVALRLGGALWPYWEARGAITEARERLDRALAAAPDHPQRAGALLASARIALRQGDAAHAERCFSESLRRFRECGDASHDALSTAGLGWVALTAGRTSEAVALCREAVERARTTHDAGIAADALNNLGSALRLARDLEGASAALEEALALRHRSGDIEGVAATLGSLAWVAVAKGDHARAQALLEEALAVSEPRRDVWYRTAAQLALAYVALAQGDVARARELAEQGLADCRALGAVQLTASALGTLAAVYALSGSARQAALLAGAARAAARGRPSLDAYGWETSAGETALAHARAELGAHGWDELVTRGEEVWCDELDDHALIGVLTGAPGEPGQDDS